MGIAVAGIMPGNGGTIFDRVEGLWMGMTINIKMNVAGRMAAPGRSGIQPNWSTTGKKTMVRRCSGFSAKRPATHGRGVLFPG